MKFNKTVFLVFLSIFLSQVAIGTTIYNVTSVGDNPTNPATNTLRWAINSAITTANTGDNVIISFNAPGLCQIVDYLPIISINNGSITFEKNSNATVDQGVEVVPAVPSSSQMISIYNVASPSTGVEFNNLKFYNWNRYYRFFDFYNTNSARFINCVFDCSLASTQITVSGGIHFVRGTNFFATGCTFKGAANAPSVSMLMVAQLSGTATVNNNVFDCSQSTSGSMYALTLNNLGWIGGTFIATNNNVTKALYGILVQPNVSPNCLVQNNQINYCSNALTVLDLSAVPQSSVIKVQNNSLSNSGNGLWLSDIQNPDKVENNVFNNNTVDVFLQTSNRNASFSMIETNSIGLPTVNTGNLFNSHSSTSPSILCRSIPGSSDYGNYQLVGLNLLGYIKNENYAVSSIERNNKIRSNFSINLPIGIFTNANAGNTPPNISLAQLGGNILTVNYTLSGLSISDQPNFVVDFYKSNANGDLVSYLGNSGNLAYASINGPHTTTLTVSGLATTDRIAATVTSSPNVLPCNNYGTSQAAYPSRITPAPVACNYNDACNPVNISCYDNSISIQVPNCPLMNFWYSFNPNGENCQESIVFTSIGNKIQSVTQWQNYDPQKCNSLGNPYFASTISGLGFTFTFNTAQIPNNNNLILIQLAGIAVPGQPNLYSYNLTADAFSSCSNCPQPPCETCIGSFSPEPGKYYIVSAWARKDNAAASVTNFTEPKIDIEFNSGTNIMNILPSGPVIDGWQKIYKRFQVPAASNDFKVTLGCTTGDCLFDDVRIFPDDGLMKSYVYDPKSMRFVAELDEENYASFFEYDEEGKLTTVKKETERGIMTIKESRSKVVKH